MTCSRRPALWWDRIHVSVSSWFVPTILSWQRTNWALLWYLPPLPHLFPLTSSYSLPPVPHISHEDSRFPRLVRWVCLLFVLVLLYVGLEGNVHLHEKRKSRVHFFHDSNTTLIKNEKFEIFEKKTLFDIWISIIDMKKHKNFNAVQHTYIPIMNSTTSLINISQNFSKNSKKNRKRRKKS